MDKGIRPAARNKFVELNELRRRGVEPYNTAKADTVFRRNVMEYLMQEFGITLASAATHYNEALCFVRELNPELVDKLGRPEDKKGGRKPKARVQQPAPEFVDAEFQQPAQFKIVRKSDNEVLATVDTFEEARDTVHSGRWNGKFCKTYWI